MCNTMECKRDSFSGAFGGARGTHWERVSHALNLWGIKIVKIFHEIVFDYIIQLILLVWNCLLEESSRVFSSDSQTLRDESSA